MARAKKITPAALEQVARLVDRGLSTSEIAEAVGCTVGTLRVKCSQMGISLRRKSRNKAGSAATRASEQSRAHVSNVHFSRRQAPASRRYQLSVAVSLPQTAVEHLHERAAAKRMSVTALASMLLEIIVRDGLYDAILDGLDVVDQPAGRRDLD